MITPINDASWPGPNAAGTGGTPAPNTSQSASGLHASVYVGQGAEGTDRSVNGPNAAGGATVHLLVATDIGTVWV